jgi:hypothetical protein
MQYSLVKVLLTVSPFRPSIRLQPRVYPRLATPRFALSTTHRPLLTFPRPLFPYTYELPLPHHRFTAPLFSYNYKLLFSQPLCFDDYLRCPLFFFGTLFQDSVISLHLWQENALTPLRTYCCTLFAVAREFKCFVIKQIHILLQKYLGRGYLRETSAVSASLRYHLPSAFESARTRRRHGRIHSQSAAT